jgi:hypothetical protein
MSAAAALKALRTVHVVDLVVRPTRKHGVTGGCARSPGSCAPARRPPSWRRAPGAPLFSPSRSGSSSWRRCFPSLAFGAVFQRVLRSERALRVFNGAMGVLLATSVIVFVW